MSEPLRILYVDDNPLDRQLVRHALESEHGGFRLTEATSRLDFERRMASDEFDLILSDFNILGYQGLQVVDFVRDTHPGLPVIIVTGTGSEETGVEALKRGAADYVIKSPSHIQRLPQTIFSVIERRRLLQERDHAEEKFRQLAENIDEVFWLADIATSTMLYVSPGFTRVWHRPAESMCASPRAWLDFLHPDDRDRIVDATQRSAQGNGAYEIEYRILRPDGEVRLIRDRAFPVRDANGRLYRIAGVARDVTDQRDLEQQSLRAQRLESIGTLAGGIAHDLNNVLAPIILSLELLRPHVHDEDGHELLQTIASSARRGATMVQQVLSFARGLDGPRVAIDVHEVLRDVERIVRDTFPKHIVMSTQLAAGHSTVLADPTQLHQVMLNLCVNARDAMPSGGSLTVRTRELVFDGRVSVDNVDGKSGPFLCIDVVDTGTGIAPDVIDRIFDPFFTTKPHGEGTGLGLSTSLTIVRSHGGFIRTLSSGRDGTRFRVFLPLYAEMAADANDPPDVALPRGAGETVLVVDDEEAILRVTRRVLESNGYRVLTAENGVDATAIFAAQHDAIALVLTDLMMPVMSGTSLVAALRMIDPTVRVIAMSGMTSASDLESMQTAGVRRVLQKPYQGVELLTAVHESLMNA